MAARNNYKKIQKKEVRWITVTLKQITDSFIAFNINSFNNLVYVVETNLWLILSIIGSLAIVVMGAKEEVDDYVTEEQNII